MPMYIQWVYMYANCVYMNANVCTLVLWHISWFCDTLPMPLAGKVNTTTVERALTQDHNTCFFFIFGDIEQHVCFYSVLFPDIWLAKAKESRSKLKSCQVWNEAQPRVRLKLNLNLVKCDSTSVHSVWDWSLENMTEEEDLYQPAYYTVSSFILYVCANFKFEHEELNIEKSLQ